MRKRLIGHGAAGVTDAQYTHKDLRALRDAVLNIDLDVRVGVIVPFRRPTGSGEDT